MKKTMFAVLCLAMTTLTCVANNHHKPAKGHNNHPRQERVDPIINMDVVSQMGLSDKQVKQIESLKEKKQEEMKALRPKKQHDGKPMAKQEQKKMQKAQPMDREQMKTQRAERQQMQKAQRAEHHAKVQAINEKYRKELQDIMGTKTYVTYVEKVYDKLAMHNSFQGRQHKMNMHKKPHRQHMHQQRPRMQRDMQQHAEKA